MKWFGALVAAVAAVVAAGEVSGGSAILQAQVQVTPAPLRVSLHEARKAVSAPVEWTARWIAFPNDEGDKVSRPVPVFRKEFTLDKPVAKAIVHVCGLGQYELSINGKKVGDAVMAPGWSYYPKTSLFDTYDVTAQVNSGANAVGIMLGNGMYNVLRIPNRYAKFVGTRGVPKAILQMDIHFADGTRTRIATDDSWKASRGPVVFTHIFGGEDYDARRELPGWDAPGFTETGWAPAAVVPAPGDGKSELLPALHAPTRIQKRYPVAKMTQPRPGVWVYDFGQNLAGWPHLKVRGPAGAAVRMIPGELLNPDGTVSQAGSGRPVWFEYTLKGEGDEAWRPRFTYYGFRYLQVQGATPAAETAAAGAEAQPKILDLASEFIHADVRKVGTFESSDDTLNRIHALINAAVLSNLQSVVTDCPHREKLGWMEQTYLMGDAIAMNYDISGLYAKLCRDMRDSQTPAGLIPDIAPEFTVFSGGFRDSPEWGSAGVILPWMLYEYYGETRVLAENYDMMSKYVAYLGAKAKDHIVAHGLGDWYDIGPRPPGNAQLTSLGITGTATYYRNLEIMAKAAKLLGKPDDAARYEALAEAVRKAFNAKFYDAAAGQYEKGSQTALAMPVAAGLADPAHRAALLQRLADTTAANKFRVTAGDVGFSYVVRALTDAHRGDVVYRMMTQSEGPGYVMQLNKGATTLTEAWDALTSSSQNHLMLGHAEAWLYRGLAGIQNAPGSVAFERILIRPQIVDALATQDGKAWVRASFDSARGMIRSEWTREGQKLSMRVTIPAGARATIHVPATRVSAQRTPHAGGQAAAAQVNIENGVAMIDAEPGLYTIDGTLP